MSKKNKLLFAFVAFLKIVGSVIELMIPLLISKSFDNYIASKMDETTIKYMVLMGLSIVFAFVFNYMGNYLASINANQITKEKRANFIKKLDELDNLQFDNIDRNDLLACLNLDFNNYYLFIQNIQRLGIRGPILLFGSLALCIIYSFRISIYLLITVFLVVLVVVVFSIVGVKKTKRLQDSYTEVIENSQDAYYGSKQIRVYNTQESELNKFDKKSVRLAKNDFGVFNVSNLSTLITTILLDGTFVLMLYISSKIINVEITIGEYLSFLSLYSIISHSSISFSKLVIIISRGKTAMARIARYESIKPLKIDKISAKSQYFVEFSNVNFEYMSKSNFKFNGLNFFLKDRKNIEIIGPLGVGKTSLFKLMAGLYFPKGGTIKLDGTQANEIARNDFGFVLQNDYIFQNSILFNIALKREYFEEELSLALQTSLAKEVVDKKENGLDEKVGGGSKLSGGEKARLLIARALLKKPKYLFLDNALSSLDYATSKQVMENIKKNYPNTIVVSICERPIDVNDNFIVVEKGTISAGDYSSLQSSNSFFKDFCREED